MKPRPIFTVAFLIFSPFALASCFSSSKVATSNEVSVGRQLTELEDARRQGIVNDKEYERLKKAIIKKNS